jgi:hypothetical protein
MDGTPVWLVSLAPSKDTTACNLFGPRCAYRLVIVKLLCPSRSAISSSGAPLIRTRLANVCRKSCQRKFLMPASVRASSNQCLPFSRGAPVLADWNTRPRPSPWSCATLRAATAASFSGMCGLFVLRPRNIQQPASPVYHVPRQAILAALTQTDINR